MIELQWRADPWSPAVRDRWIDMPRALEPGGTWETEVIERRPLGADMIVIEPHLDGVAGFNALGGPKWLRFL